MALFCRLFAIPLALRCRVHGPQDAMVLNIFLLPTLYVWVAGEHDMLPAAEVEFDEEE